MSGLTWDRVEPVEPCDSPDGHAPVDIMSMGSTVPEAVLCGRCPRAYTVVVLPRDD